MMVRRRVQHHFKRLHRLGGTSEFQQAITAQKMTLNMRRIGTAHCLIGPQRRLYIPNLARGQANHKMFCNQSPRPNDVLQDDALG